MERKSDSLKSIKVLYEEGQLQDKNKIHITQTLPFYVYLSNSAVKGIKRQNLVEMKSLKNPPPAVKMALESICTLMGEKIMDWNAMRAFIMKDNFITNIVNFDTEGIT